MTIPMKLTHTQLSLMEKLKFGDVLSGSRSLANGWQFEIMRGSNRIRVGRVGRRLLKLSTVIAMRDKGALIQIGGRSSTIESSAEWQPTHDGLAAYRAEVTP
jgi:hypothetical protein